MQPNTCPASVKAGEGLIGQAIDRKKTIIVQDVPAEYSQITSSLGNARPTALMIAPLIYGDVCLGAIELGFFEKTNIAGNRLFRTQSGSNGYWPQRGPRLC